MNFVWANKVSKASRWRLADANELYLGIIEWDKLRKRGVEDPRWIFIWSAWILP